MSDLPNVTREWLEDMLGYTIKDYRVEPIIENGEEKGIDIYFTPFNSVEELVITGTIIKKRDES